MRLMRHSETATTFVNLWLIVVVKLLKLQNFALVFRYFVMYIMHRVFSIISYCV